MSVPGEHVLGRRYKRRVKSAPPLSLGARSEPRGPSGRGAGRWGRPGLSSDRPFLSSNAVTAAAWGSACGLRARLASPTPTSATPATTSCSPAVRAKTPSLCLRSAGLQSLRPYHGEVGAAPQARRGGSWVTGQLLGLLDRAGALWPSVGTLVTFPRSGLDRVLLRLPMIDSYYFQDGGLIRFSI